MPETVTVEIDQAAKVTISTAGFSGPKCKEATAALETTLGIVASDTATREMTLGAVCQIPNQAKQSN